MESNNTKWILGGLAVTGIVVGAVLFSRRDDESEGDEALGGDTTEPPRPDPTGTGEPPSEPPPPPPPRDFGGSVNLGSATVAVPPGVGGFAIRKSGLTVWVHNVGSSNRWRARVYEQEDWAQMPSTVDEHIFETGWTTKEPIHGFGATGARDRALQWIETVYDAPAPGTGEGN